MNLCIRFLLCISMVFVNMSASAPLRVVLQLKRSSVFAYRAICYYTEMYTPVRNDKKDKKEKTCVEQQIEYYNQDLDKETSEKKEKDTVDNRALFVTGC